MNTPLFGEYTRRDLMKISLASAFGVSYSGWLGALARSDATRSDAARQRSRLLLWMNGGPSQLAPLLVTGDSDNPQARANMSVENLLPPKGGDPGTLASRFELLDFVQGEFNRRYKGESVSSHRANYERAVRMVKSQAKSAFKL